MTGHLIAAHAGAVRAFAIPSGTWILAILAAASGAYLRWLSPIGIIVVYFLIHHSGGHGSLQLAASAGWIALAAASVFVGWQFGGRAMLRHVGEREYRTRLTGAKGISSFWTRWFTDAR